MVSCVSLELAGQLPRRAVAHDVSSEAMMNLFMISISSLILEPVARCLPLAVTFVNVVYGRVVRSCVGALVR